MAAFNSQYIQQLSYMQNQIPYPNHPGNMPPWPPQLSNKAVASMWMNAGAKQLHPHEEEEVGFYELT